MFHVEQWAGIVAGLKLALREIAGIGLKARRSAGFEAENAKAESFEGRGKLIYGGAAVAAAFRALFADPDAAAKRGAGSDDNGLGAEKTMASGRDGEWLGGGIITQRHRDAEGWGVLDRIYRIIRIGGLGRILDRERD